jgi:hypothetical protein
VALVYDLCFHSFSVHSAKMGSSPLISIVGYDIGGIYLLCQSSGWLSQPTAKWKGPEGLDLPLDFKVNKDMHGLFHVETTLTVHKNSGSISCSIQLADQKREVKSRLVQCNTLDEQKLYFRIV